MELPRRMRARRSLEAAGGRAAPPRGGRTLAAEARPRWPLPSASALMPHMRYHAPATNASIAGVDGSMHAACTRQRRGADGGNGTGRTRLDAMSRSCVGTCMPSLRTSGVQGQRASPHQCAACAARAAGHRDAGAISCARSETVLRRGEPDVRQTGYISRQATDPDVAAAGRADPCRSGRTRRSNGRACCGRCGQREGRVPGGDGHSSTCSSRGCRTRRGRSKRAATSRGWRLQSSPRYLHSAPHQHRTAPEVAGSHAACIVGVNLQGWWGVGVLTIPVLVRVEVGVLARFGGNTVDSRNLAFLALRTERNVHNEKDNRDRGQHDDAQPTPLVRLCAAAAVAHRGGGGTLGVLTFGELVESLLGAQYLQGKPTLTLWHTHTPRRRGTSAVSINSKPDRVLWQIGQENQDNTGAGGCTTEPKTDADAWRKSMRPAEVVLCTLRGWVEGLCASMVELSPSCPGR